MDGCCSRRNLSRKNEPLRGGIRAIDAVSGWFKLALSPESDRIFAKFQLYVELRLFAFGRLVIRFTCNISTIWHFLRNVSSAAFTPPKKRPFSASKCRF